MTTPGQDHARSVSYSNTVLDRLAITNSPGVAGAVLQLIALQVFFKTFFNCILNNNKKYFEYFKIASLV